MDRGRPLQRIRSMHRRPRTDRDRGSHAHLIPTAAAALLALALVGLGCGQTADSPPAAAATVHAALPAGWHRIRGPINEVIEPAQVLAAASVPLRLPERSAHGCSTDELRRRLPPGAAAVQLVEATMGPGEASHPNLRKYPPRPDPFRLERRSYATYECNGPSYNIAFRDRGRAFQAFVWLDLRHVDPAVRAQAVALLNSLRVSRSPRPG